METHRIQVDTDRWVQMQDMLDRARSERAGWPPARCRAILADVRKLDERDDPTGLGGLSRGQRSEPSLH
jgi:hypothetical protein